jgi:hypothetical protein
MTQRRFPPPWSVEEVEACYVVRDRDEQALSYVYYEKHHCWKRRFDCQ